MRHRYDVVIVGARCAGAPLAALLARAGAKVALVERARRGLGNTLSSHIVEADALAFLDRLGITRRLRATGAPIVDRADIRIEDFRVSMPWPQAPGDVGGMVSIRRHVLDPILVEAAAEAGADVHMGSKVVALVEEGGRAAGVRVATCGGERPLRARLVVGADGRNSAVARLSGARRYNVVRNERALYWGYFADAAGTEQPTFLTHRWSDRFLLAIPTDGGLYQVLVWLELSDLERFAADREGVFASHIEACEPLSCALAGARRVGKLQGASRWEGFFREASGSGWVLAGDAGHFKDPAPGRGIGDAFLQVGSLAPAIVEALGRSDKGLDAAMARWARWRDSEFAEHYWLANDLGRAGAMPIVLTEIIRRLNDRGQAGRFFDLLNHRTRPSVLLTRSRVLGAAARAIARGRADRRAVVREVARLAVEDAHRRWLNRRPAYA